MLLYILKSSAILAVLLLFYKLLLEKESIHTFKRFYLLGSLTMAIIIPFITFVEYVDAPRISQTPLPMTSYTTTPIVHQEVGLMEYIPYSLWSIYAIGGLFFGYKFARNLFDIIQKIRKNPKYRIKQITNVLLLESTIPHTFFNYIFLNKQKYVAKEIPAEVLLHEETHALQKHSIDVLLIEFLQVLFWFNPVIYFMQKAIKLNHEFLADRKVLDGGIKPSLYQNILLNFSSNPHQLQLANAINYSSIKKRFTVMKTRTSKKAIVLKSVLLLPLLAIILYGFSEKKLIQKEQKQVSIESTENFRKKVATGSQVKDYNAPAKKFIAQTPSKYRIIIYLHDSGELLVHGKWVQIEQLKTRMDKFHERDNQSQTDVELIVNELAPKKLIVGSQGILSTYGSLITKVTDKQPWTLPKSNEETQEGATKSEIKEYNALAKKYNRQLSNKKSIQIFKSDVERLKYLHGIMTHEQKESAEPFPDFPEPPPAPEAPIVKVGEVSNIPPPPPPFKVPSKDGNYSEELIKAYDKFNEEGERYGKAVTSYLKNGKGKISSLHEKYKKVMILYDKFHALAVKENLMKPNVKSSPKIKLGQPSNIPPPPPAPMVRKGEKSDIPPPPKAAKGPKVKKGTKSNLPPPPPSASNVSDVEYADSVIDDVIAHQDPYDVVGGSVHQFISKGEAGTIPPTSPVELKTVKEIREKSQSVKPIRDELERDLVKPPTPPKSPLDHVIEMAKKDATFFFEGKEISSDKAIAILKKNNKINIRTKHAGLKNPLVEISTKPIIIKK